MPRAAFCGPRHSESDVYFVKCMAECRVTDESESLAASRTSPAEAVDTFNPYAPDLTAETPRQHRRRLSIVEVIAGLLLGLIAWFCVFFGGCFGLGVFTGHVLDRLNLEFTIGLFIPIVVISLVFAVCAFISVFRSITGLNTPQTNETSGITTDAPEERI